MSKYRGPRLKIIRKLGELPGLTTKIGIKKTTPGQHGQLQTKFLKKQSPYGLRLLEKQKLRFNYNISEKQLINYITKAKKNTGSTGEILLMLLEMRLDNIIYRLGMAPTILSARQLISHGHILVNQKKIDIASYSCKINDVISVKNKKTSKQLVQKYVQENSNNDSKNSYLSFNKDNLVGIITNTINRDLIQLKINELLIVEYYSRN